MKMRTAAAFFLLFVFAAFPAVSQDDGGQKAKIDFFLIPILETAFSGELRWRPDWPDDIPPDAFSVLPESRSLEKKPPQVIELSNEDVKFVVRRDGEGRLVEFPFFLENGYAAVQAAYAATGALLNMNVSVFAAKDADVSSAGDSSTAGASAAGNSDATDTSADAAKTWNIEFPAGFLPYSELSPGGSFPPIKVTSDESDFYLFIFETSSFLTETWYDGEGEMLVFCKALVNRVSSWRVSSLQIYDESGVRFQDYYFDSYGNITGVRFQDKNFSALYRDVRPVNWQTPGLRYELHWDTQGTLTIVKASGESEDLNTEYRYEYERDGSGNWIKRLEAAFKDKFGLLTPQPIFSRGVWNRRIVF